MKKTLLFLVFALTMHGLYSQSWNRSNRIFSSSNIAEIESEIDSDGNVIVFGFFDGSLSNSNGVQIVSYGATDYFIAKFLNDGSLSWMTNVGSNLPEFVFGGIDIGQNDEIFITAAFLGQVYYSPTEYIESGGSFDAFLAKYDSDGNSIWGVNCGSGVGFQSSTSLHIQSNGMLLCQATSQIV